MSLILFTWSELYTKIILRELICFTWGLPYHHLIYAHYNAHLNKEQMPKGQFSEGRGASFGYVARRHSLCKALYYLDKLNQKGFEDHF